MHTSLLKSQKRDPIFSGSKTFLGLGVALNLGQNFMGRNPLNIALVMIECFPAAESLHQSVFRSVTSIEFCL